MNIGIFFGSRSPEHDVSIITGTLIAKGLGQLGHKVVPVYISKEGSWYVGEPLGDLNFYKQMQYLNQNLLIDLMILLFLSHLTQNKLIQFQKCS